MFRVIILPYGIKSRCGILNLGLEEQKNILSTELGL